MLTSNIDIIDLGIVPEGEIVHSSFEIKNEYTEPILLVNIRSSCGCVVPMLEIKELLPSEEVKVNFSFNTRGRNGSTSKKIHITYNYNNKHIIFSQPFKCTIKSK